MRYGCTALHLTIAFNVLKYWILLNVYNHIYLIIIKVDCIRTTNDIIALAYILVNVAKLDNLHAKEIYLSKNVCFMADTDKYTTKYTS